MTLIGFSLVDSHADFPDVELDKSEHVYRLASTLTTSYIKGVKLELQGAFSEIQSEKALLKGPSPLIDNRR